MSNQLKTQLKAVLEAMAKLRSDNEATDKTEWVSQYEALGAKAQAIKSALDTSETEAQMADWMNQSAGSAVKAGFSGAALPNEGNINGISAEISGELYALNGVGDQQLKALKSGAYKDAFVQYLRGASKGMRPEQALKSEAMKVLNEGTDTAGGFWVPPDFRQELVKKMAAMAVVRPNAYVFTTGSDVASFPRVNYTTDDKYTSGVRFSWVGALNASDASEATNPIAGRENIPVHTALAVLRVTRGQMEDNSFDILGYMTNLFAEAFVLGEEDVFINGTGIGQPQGFLVHPQASTASSSAGMYVAAGTSATVQWGNNTSGVASTTGLLGVEAALPPQYENGAKWYANKATYAAVRALSDSQLRPLWALSDGFFGAYTGAIPATLLNYPIQKSQFMPDIAANALEMAFGEMNGYYIADRVGLSVAVDESIGRLKDEVVLVARKRVGGQLVHYWKLKLLKAAAS